MKTIRWLIVFVFLGSLLTTAAVCRADDRTKPLLEEALHLYSERQYVRALDLFKQVQGIDPGNKTADEYVKSCQQRIQEWETKGAEGTDANNATWDDLLNDDKKKKGSSSDTATNASDLIAARRSLVDRMRNRSTNTDNIVQIQDTKRGLQVVLYHDQLFLPGLLTLRDEALPVLENVAQLIRTKGDRDVTLTSVAHSDSTDPFLYFPQSDQPTADPSLPQTKGAGSSAMFQDIEAERSLILFTYLAQRSMGRPSSQ